MGAAAQERTEARGSAGLEARRLGSSGTERRTGRWARARISWRKEYRTETDYLRVHAYPFTAEVQDFIARHERVYVIDQNRDAQMLQLLKLDLRQTRSEAARRKAL